MSVTTIGKFGMRAFPDTAFQYLTASCFIIFPIFRTYGPAQTIGAAKRVLDLGEIPTSPEELFGFYGIARKVLMLVLNDVHNIRDGIICDTHLFEVFCQLDWSDASSADKAAREVEAWLDKEYWYEVNPIFAGLRQLWEVEANRAIMTEVAEQFRLSDDLQYLTANVKSRVED